MSLLKQFEHFVGRNASGFSNFSENDFHVGARYLLRGTNVSKNLFQPLDSNVFTFGVLRCTNDILLESRWDALRITVKTDNRRIIIVRFMEW